MLISLPVQNGRHFKTLFIALNGLFGDGSISYLFSGLENYHHAKFQAFNRK